MRAFAIVACALSLAACATTEETVAVPYAPSPMTTIMAGTGGLKVAVDATDVRTTNRGRISTKINGYGMEMAPILADRPVDGIVEDALGAELKARGFTLAPGGTTVKAAVQTFYTDFGVGVLAGSANGEVVLDVTVADAAGAERYRRSISGASKKSVQLASGKNAAAALGDALAAAFNTLFGDSAFLAALR